MQQAHTHIPCYVRCFMPSKARAAAAVAAAAAAVDMISGVVAEKMRMQLEVNAASACATDTRAARLQGL
jgi:hypothetical protein